MQSDCIFCKILEGELPASVVYKDDICTAFLDIRPVNPGHILVIPNQHAVGLSDLPEKTGAHLFKITQKMANRLKRSSLACEGVNLFLADGEAAFQEVFHVHLHAFPRFAGDGFKMSFGPQYGTITDRETLDAIAAELKSLT